jgi:hypothetical protein
MNKKDFYAFGKAYLESNACGLWDGALKASTHALLCDLFIARRLGIAISKAGWLEVDGKRLSSMVREPTVDFTSNLDKEIGFPLETAPNYKKLVPLFVDRFLELTAEWFDDHTELMSDDEVNAVATRITRNHIGYQLPAFESYGFEFVDGTHEEGSSFLTVKSKLGQIVTVKPNKCFGCSFNIDKPLSQESQQEVTE